VPRSVLLPIECSRMSAEPVTVATVSTGNNCHVADLRGTASDGKVLGKAFHTHTHGGTMTTIKFNKDADAFKVVSEWGTRFVPRMTFFERIFDQDLLDCAAQAMCCAKTSTSRRRCDAH
jgi:hypothetical protein